MSTLIPSAATALKIDAAMPGRSGTSSSVTLASSTSRATPEMRACSILGSSSSTTHVPSPSLNEERT